MSAGRGGDREVRGSGDPRRLRTVPTIPTAGSAQKEGSPSDRREFLRKLGRGAALALCGGGPLLLGACAGVPHVPYTRRGEALLVDPAALEPGGMALLENPEGGLPILLVRLESGDHAAVLTRCTHRGCQAEPVADRLVCPCHGSEYTLTGRLLQGPAEADLVRYPVHVDADGTIAVAWRPGGVA